MSSPLFSPIVLAAEPPEVPVFSWDLPESEESSMDETPMVQPNASRVSVFRGALRNGKCLLEFKIAGTSHRALGLIDTGAQTLAMDAGWAAAHGVLAIPKRFKRLGFIKGEPIDAPVARVTFSLHPAIGPDFTCTADAALIAFPEKDIALVIGPECLSVGDFHFFGRVASWEWRVDQALLDGRKLEP